MSYPRGADLLIACRSAQGAIVIVEGETREDDAHFYERWFGDRSREISFIPQNGCLKVQLAVAELQQKLPQHRIFGLVDRDFAPASVLIEQEREFPKDGILYTNYYTLENYLLDADGWYEVLRIFQRSAPSVSTPVWSSADQIREHLLKCYRQMLPVAAHNLVVHAEKKRGAVDDRGFFEHPSQITDLKMVQAELMEWGRRCGAAADLGRQFCEKLSWLEQLPPEQWPCWISGKELLNRLWLPQLKHLLRIPPEHLKTLYIDRMQFKPPADLVSLVERIIAATNR